jgi:cobalamin-dependent methionine synthase I
MKDKRYKYVEDVIEDYIELTDEQIEIPLLITKAKEKFEALKLDLNGNTIAQDDAEGAFKIYTQLKKHEERKNEVNQELAEVETILKEFLDFLNNSKLSYEKKDDNKNKHTFLFWLEDGQIKSNRL